MKRDIESLEEFAEDAEKGIRAAKSSAPCLITSLVAAGVMSLLLAYVSGIKTGFFSSNRAYVEALIVLGLGAVIVECIGRAAYSAFLVAGVGTAKLMRTVTRVIGYGVLVTILASVFKASAAAAAALGGFAGMAVGFASQQVLGNALAGLFLAVSRPFDIGDEVNIPGAKAKGRVVDIGVMYTVLVDNGKKVLVPSSKIVGNVIEISTGGEREPSS